MKYADLSTILKQEIQKCIDMQYADLVVIEKPTVPLMGDFTSNIAMILAKYLKKPPAVIANEIKEKLEDSEEIKKYFKINVPGPAAFINFYINDQTLDILTEEILLQKDRFGQGEKKNKKILLEFLSANPTGPMHLGNGRGGFTGDCLANVLQWAGFDVWREYYVNDVGNQIKTLGLSVLAAAGFLDAEKEKLYRAAYIEALRKELLNLPQEDHPKIPREIWIKVLKGEQISEKTHPEFSHALREELERSIERDSVKKILTNIKMVVEKKMRIKFDKWFSEKKHLYDSEEIEKALKFLKDEKLTYKKDDALWFASSQFGDDKDRVLIKTDGEKTYFLSDIAYHKDKFDRGFDKLINIWGADHHGYINRTKAAIEALGYNRDQLNIIIVQLVRLIENGKEVKMSKRGGTFVTIEELIDEVGHDVARFFFVMRAPETHMDFDLNLAKEQSSKNPVYYVQYAHARICSILKKAEELEKIEKLHKTETEKAAFPIGHDDLLKRHLLAFTSVIEETAQTHAVHHLPAYAIKLADLFHRFYEHCRVIENDKVNEERLKIIKAAQIVLKNVLTVIGVSAPKKM